MMVTQVSGNWKDQNIVRRRYPSSEPPQCWCEVSYVLLCFVSLAGQGGKMLTAPFVCFFLYWWLKQLWNSSVMLSPSKIAAIVILCRPQWELCRNSNWCHYVCLLPGDVILSFFSFVFFYNATQFHLFFMKDLPLLQVKEFLHFSGILYMYIYMYASHNKCIIIV